MIRYGAVFFMGVERMLPYRRMGDGKSHFRLTPAGTGRPPGRKIRARGQAGKLSLANMSVRVRRIL